MIDFHCHIDLYPDPQHVARACDARGLHVLSVTTTPSAWHGTSALAHGRIRTALGLHPQLAHERHGELALFEELLPQARYVGEIGLDGAPEFRANWQVQETVFRCILDVCAKAGGRIMSIHSRRASKAVLDCLATQPDSGVPVLHWFSGTTRDLDRAIEFGCWFSVGPAMLRGERGRALAARMPRERVLTESDGPFAQIEGRSAWPWEVDRAVAGLAALWGIDERKAQVVLDDNLRHLAQWSRAGRAEPPDSGMRT
ncbi:MAG: TatD family hydrolase [Rhodospirillaceae bacterium]|nr:TatD family hydrolase [Rhodospirillaceae bacterium]